VQFKKGERSFADRTLADMDRNAKAVGPFAEALNWATKLDNTFTRGAMEATLGIDARAYVPSFADIPLDKMAPAYPSEINPDAPAFGRKAALYSTCYVQWNTPGVGLTALKVLAHNGVHTELVYPGCCGMPKLENGDLEGVAAQARQVAAAFEPFIDAGHDIVVMTPSCALMLKSEWPLLLPNDPLVAKLAKATFDITEYIVTLANAEGLAPGLSPLEGGVAVHFACHARAQNIGPKAVELLRLIPGMAKGDVTLIERCSGHGGKWGMFKQNFDAALRVGTPAARGLLKADKRYVVSECPLAAPHLLQVMEGVDAVKTPNQVSHPIELFALAYGLK
jgi:glycerol-3-phosphate dehydrogenase subunit C